VISLFRYMREALMRGVQVVVGTALFDVWPLLSLRHAILRLYFQAGAGFLVGRHFQFHRPHFLRAPAGARLTFAQNVKINSNVEIDYSGGVEIADDVWISQNVIIETHEHVIGSGPKSGWLVKWFPLEIGRDAWIGANAIILPGVKRIGARAIVGAAAVVSREVLDGEIVGGVPARMIGQRPAEREGE